MRTCCVCAFCVCSSVHASRARVRACVRARVKGKGFAWKSGMKMPPGRSVTVSLAAAIRTGRPSVPAARTAQTT
eukprot:6209893-Pleurochrysis_carterae.AAC.2